MSRENLRRTSITVAFLCLVFFVDLVLSHFAEQAYRAFSHRLPLWALIAMANALRVALLTAIWTFALGCTRGD